MVSSKDILFENTLTKGLIIINTNIKLQTKFMYGFTLLSGKIISTIFIIKAPTIIEMIHSFILAIIYHPFIFMMPQHLWKLIWLLLQKTL